MAPARAVSSSSALGSAVREALVQMGLLPRAGASVKVTALLKLFQPQAGSGYGIPHS